MHAGIPVLQQPVAGRISVCNYLRNIDFLIFSVKVFTGYIFYFVNVFCHIFVFSRVIVQQAVGRHLRRRRRSCPSGVHLGSRAVSQRIVSCHPDFILYIVSQMSQGKTCFTSVDILDCRKLLLSLLAVKQRVGLSILHLLPGHVQAAVSSLNGNIIWSWRRAGWLRRY